jgi:hypothetical protein
MRVLPEVEQRRKSGANSRSRKISHVNHDASQSSKISHVNHDASQSSKIFHVNHDAHEPQTVYGNLEFWQHLYDADPEFRDKWNDGQGKPDEQPAWVVKEGVLFVENGLHSRVCIPRRHDPSMRS